MAIENKFDEENIDEEDVAAEEEGEHGDGLDKKKILIFIVAPLLILSCVGAGLYFTGMLDKFFGGGEAGVEEHEVADSGSKKNKSGGKHGSKGGKIGSAYFVEIPNMIVNLSGTENKPRYLRLSVQIELDNEDDVVAIESVMPRVVDQFQTYLRELRVKDIKGSTGLYRLRIELLSRLNAAAYPIEVKSVLFQEILIQ